MKFWHYIRKTNSAFLIGTFLTTILGVPLYILNYGIDTFQIALFTFFFVATGLSITLGYHRLFSHLTFHAKWPVKVWTLLFGAAAFEGSALGWCADHRRHHKHVDHDEDPYDISRGFFHAHIGWLLFRTGPETPLTWVRDLQKDRLAWWQHQYYVPIAVFMSFVLPTAVGWLYGGPVAALGAFLIAGVARIVFVHHMTFCINSLCHWIGDRPYSSKCSARDSFLMAIFTFGEGYHNYHHEFQYDYRNGIRPWHFDPTKWTIWLLSKCGLVSRLRTVPEEKILRARIEEQEHRIREHLESRNQPICDSLHATLEAARARVLHAAEVWETHLGHYREAIEKQRSVSRREIQNLKQNLQKSSEALSHAMREWVRQVEGTSSANA
jgi:stearoyl-CoA desaturase (Delta-9 desaturase)